MSHKLVARAVKRRDTVRWAGCHRESLLRASGLPYTIARPSFITGPGRDETRPLERVGAAAGNVAGFLLRVVGANRLGASLRSMTGRELAEGLVRHAFDPSSENAVVSTAELYAR